MCCKFGQPRAQGVRGAQRRSASGVTGVGAAFAAIALADDRIARSRAKTRLSSSSSSAASARATAAAAKIRFPGAFFRSDIGRPLVKVPTR